MWAIFYNTLRARGPFSFSIKKTKGHALADSDYLRKFPHLRTEAQHNNQADLLAGKARFHFYHAYHVDLSEILAKRVDRYVNFVRLIHNVIYRMQLAIREVKAAPAFKMLHPELAIPDYILHQQPSHYLNADYDYLPLKVTQQQLQSHLDESKPVITGLSHLLVHCRCAHLVDHPGLTWYELFLLALAFTPQPHTVVSSHSAQSAKSITFLLREFAVDTMKYVKFTIQQQSHK